MRRGEVWWVSFPAAMGGEIRKNRPVIIVSNDMANRHLSRVQVIPLTSNVTKVFPSEALVKIGDQVSKALADQIATVAKERLQKPAGHITGDEMADIERAMRIQLGLG
ncbi:MAG: type II toxin-antitoxin system PemK/MazF family toxin [Rhodospirillaceae bacterium]|nr:type II toxin-antitoxin system PemK/MazF family toxin [Rhodospirillaceae bacterium]